MQDTIVILFVLFLRVGLPLAVTIGVGYLIQRWLYRDIMLEAEERERVEEGKIIPFERRAAIVGERAVTEVRMSAPCWDVKNCPPDVRENCPAYPSYLESSRPCWMTFQLTGDKLREECLDCEIYQLRPAASD